MRQSLTRLLIIISDGHVLDNTQYVPFVNGLCDTRLNAHCYACNIVWIQGKFPKIVGIVLPCTSNFFFTSLIGVLEPVHFFPLIDI